MKIGLGIGIQKRSNAGGISFSPSDIPGLQLWLESDLGITLVGSDVDVWADQSGNGNDASAPASINRPAYGTNTLNGIDVLTFNGSSSVMILPDLLADADNNITVFAVAKQAVAATSSNTILRQGFETGVSFTSLIRFSNPDSVLFGVSSNSTFTGASYTSAGTQAQIITGKYDKANVTIYKNGAFANSSPFTSDIFNVNRPFVLGASASDNTLSFGFESFLNGDIAAILVYNVALSDTDRGRVETYLANKFGITLA